MSLLEELINRRAQKEEQLAEYRGVVDKWRKKCIEVDGELGDLHLAIRALSPLADTSPEERDAAPLASENSGEQIEIPEGFTRWEGGECPVDPATEVEIYWLWGGPPIMGPEKRSAGDSNWTGRQITLPGNAIKAPVVAYRILSPAPAEGESSDA